MALWTGYAAYLFLTRKGDFVMFEESIGLPEEVPEHSPEADAAAPSDVDESTSSQDVENYMRFVLDDIERVRPRPVI